jgi:hypothetical protein
MGIRLARTGCALALGLCCGATLGCGSDDEEASKPTPPLPELAEAPPTDGIPRTAWLVLRFASAVDPKSLGGFHLDCGSDTPKIDADLADEVTVVVNPRSELPPGAACTLVWSGPSGREQVEAGVAGAGAPAIVAYDRADTTSLEPFPDDFWLVDDPATPTGRRVALPLPDRPSDVQTLIGALMEPSKSLDGFSPLAPIVVSLPDAPDPQSLPQSESESLDALATVGLFDVTPDSASYLKRVPFDLLIENETSKDGSNAHDLVIFSSIPLQARGHYVLVVSNRALIDATRPLQASEAFAHAADPTAAHEGDVEQRASTLAANALAALEQTTPPIRRDDVALALGFSVRSSDDITRDRETIRETLGGLAEPTFTIASVDPDTASSSSIAAIVTGSWTAPSFRDGDFVSRGADGLPKQNGTVDIPFVLALPKAAASAPVPIVIYQHGTPGSAEAEVPLVARGLAAAGFAVIGFTDIPNRELTHGTDAAAYATAIFTTFLTQKRAPDYLSLLPNAEQLALIRLIPALGSIDVLPIGAEDGKPELDVNAPLGYFGISQGSIRGVGLVAYTPEIHAAALTVGGGRWSTTLVHQATGGPLNVPIYGTVTQFFPNVTWSEYWVGTALAQMAADDQDELMQAPFLYRTPLDLGTDARPSLLLTEGLNDGFVPKYATRAAAWAFGIPQLLPSAEPVPFLEAADAPLSGNIRSDTSAAFFQFVPKGYAGATPTPGCVTLNLTEGHYCAQEAKEAGTQRVHFFETALTGTPEIIDPFAGP